MEIIRKQLTLEYWPVNEWFEGRIREVPDVLSQGKDLAELEDHVREDVAHLVSDREEAKRRGYGHLDAADIFDAELKRVRLDRFNAAVAQLFALSPDRREKVYIYIEDLVDLEALERRADEDDARRAAEGGEGGEEEQEEW
jgi:hypothetical protein